MRLVIPQSSAPAFACPWKKAEAHASKLPISPLLATAGSTTTRRLQHACKLSPVQPDLSMTITTYSCRHCQTLKPSQLMAGISGNHWMMRVFRCVKHHLGRLMSCHRSLSQATSSCRPFGSSNACQETMSLQLQQALRQHLNSPDAVLCCMPASRPCRDSGGETGAGEVGQKEQGWTGSRKINKATQQSMVRCKHTSQELHESLGIRRFPCFQHACIGLSHNYIPRAEPASSAR